ncbi:MAG: glutamate--tRNA ligase [Candidatus Dependentiae bacterium]
MKNKIERVRFAPSPTGMMHLGNIRTALMNFLFAKQKNGTFVLRIEDTDPSRNFDKGAKKIIEDLTWLGMSYDEGPEKSGPYAPYFQSERTDLYKKTLQQLIDSELVYRCFCTNEELDKRRARQIALKKPPRYDRACLHLSTDEIQEKLNANTPFIWRFKLDHEKKININDLAHGQITFDLKNFSDFPLSRSDGSFTFMFANFVDDMLMKMTTVVRGEDHLTNTAGQAALYNALNAPLPTFWHLPILCNIEGKKLSKRDFGFSLRDLKDAGFLPEALLNYLAIIGGGSFKDEIMSIDELTQAIDFDKINATGQVKYDVEKLKWINNKWIDRIDPMTLTEGCLPFLKTAYPQVADMDIEKLSNILQILKTDFNTLKDSVDAVRFYFEQPTYNPELLAKFENKAQLSAIVSELLDKTTDDKTFTNLAKQKAKEHGISIKNMFSFIRVGLMGSIQGPSIHDMLAVLGAQESQKRLKNLISS